MAITSRRGGAAGRRVAIVATDAGRLLRLRTPLLAAIARDGHKLLSLTGAAGKADLAALTELGAETDGFLLGPHRIRTLGDKQAIQSLTASLTAWKPNVVLAFGWKPMLLAARAAERAGVPRLILVATGLGDMASSPGNRPGVTTRWATRWLAQRAMKAAHALVVHNHADETRLRELGLLPPELDVHVLPGPGIDLLHYAQAPLPPIDKGFVFAMVSSRDRRKGVIEFCQAAQRVKAKSPTARFILATNPGEGKSAVDLKELRAYEPSVELDLAPSDVRAILAGCHVFVYPSWGEGLAQEVVEALATGRPAITTAVAGCRETVDERVSGVLVPPRDPMALAAAMESFLRRPDLMAWMAQASRHKAERRFDANAVNATLLRLLDLPGRS